MSITVNLKEYIHDEMDLLFVALNAPAVSNANQHWFSGNLSFWNVLYEAGIITKSIWKLTEGEGLKIAPPKTKPCEHAFVFKIERKNKFIN